jgi:chaperonin GroEL
MQAVSSSTIVTGARARELMLQALATGARAIGSSLGPNGRGLMFDGGSGIPLYSSSGLDIVRRVTDESGAGSVALRILRDALWEVKRELEDGTARTACVAVALYAQAAKTVAAGTPLVLLHRDIRQLQDELPAIVSAQRREPPGGFDIARSAYPDEQVVRAVSEAFSQLPEKGAIDVRPGGEPGVSLERYSGYCLDVRSEAAGASVEEQGLRFEMDAAHVLVVNEVLTEFGPLVRILEQFALHSKALIIVARGFEGAARATLHANRAALHMHVLGIVPAEVSEQAMHVLDDLCAATGATMVSQETATALENVRPSMLGRASKVVIEHGRAVFSGPGGDAKAVRERRALLLAQAAAQRYLALDREKLHQRAARLGLGWAVLRVGARTTWEAEQHVEGARAALAALAASAASGVVDGGGRVFTAVAESLMKLRADSTCNVRRAALDCVASGCHAIPARLASNAGNAVEPHLRHWTADPLSTTLAILQHAVSLAATLLTVEVLIC